MAAASAKSNPAKASGRWIKTPEGYRAFHPNPLPPALDHLDTFSHIGVFSGGSIGTEDISDMAHFKEKVKLVFVSYGSLELGGDRPRRGGDPKENVEALQEAGVNAVFYVSPETAHEWHTWRRSLHQFAPLLFKH